MLYLTRLKIKDDVYFFNWYNQNGRFYIKMYDKYTIDITWKLKVKTTKLGFISIKGITDPYHAMTNILWNYLHGSEFSPVTDFEDFINNIIAG